MVQVSNNSRPCSRLVFEYPSLSEAFWEHFSPPLSEVKNFAVSNARVKGSVALDQEQSIGHLPLPLIRHITEIGRTEVLVGTPGLFFHFVNKFLILKLKQSRSRGWDSRFPSSI